MYFLLGLEKNLETIAVLSRSFLKQDPKYTSFNDLKEAYFSFIKMVQLIIPDLCLKDQIHFVREDYLLDQLINLFLDNDNGLNILKISGHDFKKIDEDLVLERKFQLIKKSLDVLRENNFEYYFLIQLLFSYVFLIYSEGVICATHPKVMGSLLMNHKTWEVEDVCEMFIHEAAHQLASLDEYRYEHYTDILKLDKSENYAVSAIRKTKRPLNKVIHSLIVAFEIFAYRTSVVKSNTAAKVHPQTNVLKEQIIESIDSIIKERHLKDLLSPRTNLILELIEQRIQIS